jgi:hypothetical protein
MFRLITICAAVVLGCVLVGGYLANDNVAQSIVGAVPTESEHVLTTSSEGDSEAKVETTDEIAEDAGDTTDDADSGDEDDSGNDSAAANASPADEESDAEQTEPDE